MRLPRPDGTQAVLVGTSRYDSLPDLPAIGAGLSALAGLLFSEDVLGLPASGIHVLAEPPSPRAIDEAVRAAAVAAEDTLLVYYAGHGLIDARSGELYLAVGESDRTAPHSTAVPYAWIRNAALDGPPRRILILDCCFSGRALNSMDGAGDLPIEAAEVDGTAVLAAAHENRTALAEPGEPFTAFTTELVAVLREGIGSEGPLISLRTVFRQIDQALRAKSRPAPQAAFRNTSDDIAFRNRSWRGRHDPTQLMASRSRQDSRLPTRVASPAERVLPDTVVFDSADSATGCADALATAADVLLGEDSAAFARLPGWELLTPRSLYVPLVDQEYVELERLTGRVARLLTERRASQMPVVCAVHLGRLDMSGTVLDSLPALSFPAHSRVMTAQQLRGPATAANVVRLLLSSYAKSRPPHPARGHDSTLPARPQVPQDGHIV